MVEKKSWACLEQWAVVVVAFIWVVTVPIFVFVLCACLFAFFWLVRYPSMSKRKLRIDDGPGAQFRALRQLPGVSQELGRNIVSLLRDDDRGKGVCKRKKEIAPEACGIQVRLRDEGNPEIEIVANSLPRLIEKKGTMSTFFAFVGGRLAPQQK